MNDTDANKSKSVTLSLYSSTSDQIRGRVFGQLARLAQPYITNYYSDLYLDAEWIRKYLPVDADEPGQFQFNYAVNESGTAIGTENSVLAYREHKYRLTYETRHNQRRNGGLEHHLHIEDVSESWIPTPIAA